MIDSFQIPSSLQGLNELRAHLERIAVAWDLSQKQLFEINLILEEICVNYLEHAAKKTIDHIEVTLSLQGTTLFLTVTDQGPEFDPTGAAEPDVHLPLDKRKAGGLGLYLVRRFSDNISYSRTNRTNTLVIEKKMDEAKGERDGRDRLL